MRRLLVGLVAVAVAPAARAGVVVVANFTPAAVTVTVTERDRPRQTVTLAPAQVAPVTVTGPSILVLPATPQHLSFNLDPYNAYVILPDEKTGRRLEGVELPGAAPERDARPELNPAPRDVWRIPVTLLVDDIDPRNNDLWQGTLRKRLADASAVIEAQCGVRFEPAGYALWKSDPQASTVPELLADFQQKVKTAPGALAIGYTSRKVEEKEKEPAPYGGSRTAPANHLIMREWTPKTELERTEALAHHLARVLGAIPVPDQGSLMRPRLGDGLALHADYRMRFDPLNALALNIWADEGRGGKLLTAADVSPTGRVRLRRVYGALMKASPGDPSALAYLNEFDRDLAQAPPAKKGDAPEPKKNADPPKAESARDVIARAALAAVTAKARANVGPGGLTGDDLTAAYVRAAATAALAEEVDNARPDDRVGGFLLGLAIALDDTDALRADEATREQVTAVESEAARDERREVLGNPTLRGRRDLSRRFAAGVGSGELLPRHSGEAAALARTFLATERPHPAGVGLPALAADLAGLEFARQSRDDLSGLTRLASSVSPAALVPDVSGLPDGLSPQRFLSRYSSHESQQFQEALSDLRRRVRALPKS